MSTAERPHWVPDYWGTDFAPVNEIDLNDQSVEIDLETPGEEFGKIRRSTQCPTRLVTRLRDEYSTVHDVIRSSAKVFPDRPCVGVKQGDAYEWMTYAETVAEIDTVGRGIKAALIAHDASLLAEGAAQPKIGIFSKNSRRWVLALHGTYSQSFVNVAVYDTFAENEMVHVINHSEMSACFVSKALTPQMFAAASRLDSLRIIIQFEDVTEEQRKTVPEGFTFISYADLLKRGNADEPLVPPTPDTLATIMYTSGTTGVPKGVMLTHGNLIAGQAGAILRIEPPNGEYLNEENIYISYLPLAHSFERVAMCCIFTVGGAVGFYSGDIKHLVDDISALKPTLMAGVPRVFDKVYTAVMDKISQEGLIKRAIFNFAYKVQDRAGNSLFIFPDSSHFNFKVHHGHRYQLLDKIVFDKIKAKLGGHVVRIVTGGAPLTTRTYDFIRTCFCSEVYQGYGLSEASGSSIVSFPHDSKLSIGNPCPTIEVMLAPVEGMPQYGKESNSGEIWMRGATVFSGYWKMPEKTAEDLREDGWFKTGDIAQWTPQGTLLIVDRKKNIFKLAQGEYVAAEHLEGIYSESPLVGQIFVTGSSHHSFLLAVVTLAEVYSQHWAEHAGVDIESDEFNNHLLEDLNRIHLDKGLKGYERIRGVVVHREEFNTSNDLATPTMKLRRPQLRARFKEQLDALAEKQADK